MFIVPVKVKQGHALPGLVSAVMLSTGVLFSVYLGPLFCTSMFLVISLFKMASKWSTEVLSSVCNCKKTVMCLLQKMYVDNLHSGLGSWPGVQY